MLWANDAQGVRKVYPFLKDSDSGTIEIYVEATTTDSTDGNGTPTSTILSDVYDVIEFNPDETLSTYERGRKPLQANIETISVIVNPIDITITGLSTNTTAIQNSIETNLIDYLYDIRPFVAGADLARNKNDILYLARILSVITDVIDSSNSFTDVQMQVNGTTQSSYLFERENIPYLRNLTFN